MWFERIEKLKQQYTDQYVQVDAKRPELARFGGVLGQVKTINTNGRALVQFDQDSNRGWYDIALDYLKVIDEPELPAEPVPTKAIEQKSTAAKSAPAKPMAAKDKPAPAAPDPAPAAAEPEEPPPLALSPLEVARQEAQEEKAASAPAEPSPENPPGQGGAKRSKRPAGKQDDKEAGEGGGNLSDLEKARLERKPEEAAGCADSDDTQLPEVADNEDKAR